MVENSVFLVLVAVFLLVHGLVLLIKPSLFVAKPRKPFGVEVNIVDKRWRLRRARLTGLLELTFLTVGVALYYSSCGAAPCRP